MKRISDRIRKAQEASERIKKLVDAEAALKTEIQREQDAQVKALEALQGDFAELQHRGEHLGNSS